MRRRAAIFVLAALLAGCASGGGLVGRGRRGSWQRVQEPAFAGEPSYVLHGLTAPGDGYPAWTATGGIRTAAPRSRTAAAVWSSLDGARWARTALDQGNARESSAAGAWIGRRPDAPNRLKPQWPQAVRSGAV